MISGQHESVDIPLPTRSVVVIGVLYCLKSDLSFPCAGFEVNILYFTWQQIGNRGVSDLLAKKRIIILQTKDRDQCGNNLNIVSVGFTDLID